MYIVKINGAFEAIFDRQDDAEFFAQRRTDRSPTSFAEVFYVHSDPRWLDRLDALVENEGLPCLDPIVEKRCAPSIHAEVTLQAARDASARLLAVPARSKNLVLNDDEIAREALRRSLREQARAAWLRAAIDLVADECPQDLHMIERGGAEFSLESLVDIVTNKNFDLIGFIWRESAAKIDL